MRCPLEKHYRKGHKNECWPWLGKLDKGGYGVLDKAGHSKKAHRAVFQASGKIIPEGWHIDHLCRNRSCVNPNHLEAVIPLVNHLRGNSPIKSIIKRECPLGHKYWFYNNSKGHLLKHCDICDKPKNLKRYIKEPLDEFTIKCSNF